MKKLGVWILVIGALIAVCHSLTRRTVAVDLGSSGYELAFTVDWGFGMDQRFRLKRSWVPWPADSSRWIEIFDKPYNSGATLYVSEDGETYYVGAGYTLLTIVPDEGTLDATCNVELLPKRTPLAELLLVSDLETDEQLDPGAPRVNTYVPTEEPKALLSDPAPTSKYYKGVRYIGRFGVTGERGSRRGSGVGFAPAAAAPEPRLGLEFSCG